MLNLEPELVDFGWVVVKHHEVESGSVEGDHTLACWDGHIFSLFEDLFAYMTMSLPLIIDNLRFPPCSMMLLEVVKLINISWKLRFYIFRCGVLVGISVIFNFY